MIEIHAWAVISFHYSDDDEEKELNFQREFDHLMREKYQVYLKKGVFDIKEYNLMKSLQIFGNFNHILIFFTF